MLILTFFSGWYAVPPTTFASFLVEFDSGCMLCVVYFCWLLLFVVVDCVVKNRSNIMVVCPNGGGSIDNWLFRC